MKLLTLILLAIVVTVPIQAQVPGYDHITMGQLVASKHGDLLGQGAKNSAKPTSCFSLNEINDSVKVGKEFQKAQADYEAGMLDSYCTWGATATAKENYAVWRVGQIHVETRLTVWPTVLKGLYGQPSLSSNGGHRAFMWKVGINQDMVALVVLTPVESQDPMTLKRFTTYTIDYILDSSRN